MLFKLQSPSEARLGYVAAFALLFSVPGGNTDVSAVMPSAFQPGGDIVGLRDVCPLLQVTAGGAPASSPAQHRGLIDCGPASG